MWLVELLLISLVGGTILGVAWRAIDEYRERAEREAARRASLPEEVPAVKTE